MAWQRPDRRFFDEIRPVRFETHFTDYAAGSVLTHCGNTKVLCTATIQNGVPNFLLGQGQGWLTAEYRMLPGATQERQQRETYRISGRTQEIQRLIGRSLRAALDLSLLGERTITIDADVLQADAGTRTTAITGGYVALALAIAKLQAEGTLLRSPLRHPVAAVSVGLIGGEPVLDLNYPEDLAADVDLNVVMTGNLDLIEVQGTAETGTYSRSQLNQMLDLAERGITQFVVAQRAVLGQSDRIMAGV
jgi:ribonuclease PH